MAQATAVQWPLFKFDGWKEWNLNEKLKHVTTFQWLFFMKEWKSTVSTTLHLKMDLEEWYENYIGRYNLQEDL